MCMDRMRGGGGAGRYCTHSQAGVEGLATQHNPRTKSNFEIAHLSTAVQQRDGWKAAEIKFGSAGVVPALLLTSAAAAASSSSLSFSFSLSQ
jgi:hypothetical protein